MIIDCVVVAVFFVIFIALHSFGRASNKKSSAAAPILSGVLGAGSLIAANAMFGVPVTVVSSAAAAALGLPGTIALVIVRAIVN